MNVHLVFLGVYSALLIVVGLIVGRWVKTSGAFFVAGRKLGPVLLFSTLLAANIGAGSILGASQLGYTNGLAAWWWVGSAGIGTLILAWFLGPRIWRVAKEQDLRTLGDFLELRYGTSVRAITSSLLWIATLFVLAAQLIGGALVFEAVAGIPKLAGCLLAGLVMTAYFTAGGLLASAWVNLVQLVVLMVGLLIALPLALGSIGGGAGLTEAAAAIDPSYLRFWGDGGLAIKYMALLIPAFIVSPGLVQKVYGARDARTVRLGVTAAGIAMLLFAFVPPLFGMIARVAYPALENQGMALPLVLVRELPVLLGSLGLAAIFSAEVSSADAVLFMLATSLSKDLYLRFLRPDATDARVLLVARLAAVAGGLLGVLLAILFETIVQALTIFYSILSVSLFVPVVAGITSRRVGAPEALGAIGLGVPVLLAIHLQTGGAGFGVFNPTLIALGVSGVGFVTVGWFHQRSVKEKHE